MQVLNESRYQKQCGDGKDLSYNQKEKGGMHHISSQ